MIYSIKHVYLVVLELENQHVQKGKQCYIYDFISPGAHIPQLCEIGRGYSIFIHRFYLQGDIDPLVQATKLEFNANSLENLGT
jgi:hypothetical protein